MLRTLSFIARHPLTRDRPLAGLARFARWQIQSRLQKEVVVPWIGNSKLVARNGMTGATGNIYCGLHEFADMGFLLHLLRPDDLFVDVGANIGSYTILASAVVGSKTLAVEPDPNTMRSLRRNIEANGISDQVELIEAAVGDEAGKLRFTVGLDTINHVTTNDDPLSREVDVRTLNEITYGHQPVFVKLDVEGFEDRVIAGATELLHNGALLALATEGRSDAITGPLRAAGFSERHYDPFNRTLSTTPMHKHSNALFVRDIDAVEARLVDARSQSIFGFQI